MQKKEKCLSLQIAVRSMFEGHPEAVARRCSVEKLLLKLSKKSQENICVAVSFLMMLRDSILQFYWKRDSNTSVFLRILRDFLKHLFAQNTSDGYFWNALEIEMESESKRVI